MTNEISVHRLTTMHNLWFFQRLMDRIREAIRSDRLEALYDESRAWGRLAGSEAEENEAP
jgi:tRNA-guanine family transglycosylase